MTPPRPHDTAPVTGWDPDQYGRFAAERKQPFTDLLGLVRGRGQQRVVDLGCGSGELTRELHDVLGAAQTTGVDNSTAMLERAAAHAGTGVDFVAGDLAGWAGPPADLVFANASLQWVPNHQRVLTQWAGALLAGGELAVQVPANADHPSHVVSRAVAQQFLVDPVADPVAENVLDPGRYAEILDALGFGEQHVRLQVYGHRLASSRDVVEWVKGTSLTRFRAVMTPEVYEEFLAAYTRELLAEIGEQSPYFYAFKRILIYARHA
jgi:trans-aconitate 2-methyltransferase